MGGRGREFRCQGEYHADWRQLWEQVLTPTRRSKLHRVQQVWSTRLRRFRELPGVLPIAVPTGQERVCLPFTSISVQC